MARKYEFKPDKLNAGFLNKIYLTKKQRRSILRWTLYSLVLLLVSVLQDVILCRFRLLGATTDLVPLTIILICLAEGAEKGCFFALIASALYLFSGSAPGYYSMVLITFLAILASIGRQAYLQRSFGSTLLCAGIAMLLYELLTFFMGLFLGLTLPGRIGSFLLTALLSLPALLVINPICMSIEALGGETWKE